MPDTDLIASIARGQQAALGTLYDRHGGLLLAILTRILRDSQEAEDVLHEVFLEVWQHAGDYDPARGGVRAWLVTRARSRGLDRVRALGRARALPTEGLTVEGPPLPAPADVISVRRALQQLAPELRILLELGYYAGMSSAEIAEHERLAIGTVKSRVARALAELRVSCTAHTDAALCARLCQSPECRCVFHAPFARGACGPVVAEEGGPVKGGWQEGKR